MLIKGVRCTETRDFSLAELVDEEFEGEGFVWASSTPVAIVWGAHVIKSRD